MDIVVCLNNFYIKKWGKKKPTNLYISENKQCSQLLKYLSEVKDFCIKIWSWHWLCEKLKNKNHLIKAVWTDFIDCTGYDDFAFH